jgi:hypothetical protein
LALIPKSTGNKSQNGQWDYIKLKSFCVMKKINNRVKRHLKDGRKIFANYLSNKELLSRIYEKLKQLKSLKKKNLIKRWTN